MNILITGSAGFIGFHLIQHLQKKKNLMFMDLIIFQVKVKKLKI